MSAPTTVGTIPAQSYEPSEVVSLPLSPYFTDADSTATKSYSVSGLPAGLSLNTSTGALTGTPTTPGTYAVTFTCTTSDGASNSFVQTIIVAAASSAAQVFYVDWEIGSDAYDGLSATVDGGGVGPWQTITRANSVQPHASGNVEVRIRPGTYRNQTYTPQYSGTDNTHRIILTTNGTGVVEIMGPSSGKIQRAFQIGDASTVRSYITIARAASDSYIRVDGEVVFGLGGGEASKGADIELFGHLDRVAYVNGVHVILECAARRTVGYDGVEFGSSVDLFEDRIDWGQHGTAYHSDGNDFGDCFRINQSISPGS